MTSRHWFSALALFSAFLATWAQACGLRDNGATYIDAVTGIEIQKCAVRENWTGSTCTGSAKFFSFDEAVKEYGRGEWRLLTKEEAERVVNRSKGCRDISIDLPNWTSTSGSRNAGDDDNRNWYVNLSGGFVRAHTGQGFASGPVRLVRTGQSSGGATALGNNTISSSNSTAHLDTPERLQAAQANQQQADRVFAGKRRTHDDNANTEQPTNGPRENTVTNRGPVRVNVAYCLDSHKRAYSGSLKCSAQRFGYTSVEVGQTVEVLPPNSGQQALTFSCKHPAKPYDVEFANDGLSGRCAAY